MPKYYYIIVVAAVLLYGCSGETPDASFTVSDFNIGVNEPVTLINTSVDADYYEWYFGDGTSSEEENPPPHYYESEGTYLITLIAYNMAGRTQAWGFVFVTDKYTVTFNNTTFTDVYVSVNNSDEKLCLVGGNVEFEFDSNPQEIDLYAYTYGKNSSGDILGEYVEWDQSIDVSFFASSYETDLFVESSLFFLKMQNTGISELGPVRINVGRSNEMEEDVYIPANGGVYTLGYYYAYSNTRIEADYNNGINYVYWIQGTNFTFSWLDNQTITALNDEFKMVEKHTLPNELSNQSLIVPLKSLEELVPIKKKEQQKLNVTRIYGTAKSR